MVQKPGVLVCVCNAQCKGPVDQAGVMPGACRPASPRSTSRPGRRHAKCRPCPNPSLHAQPCSPRGSPTHHAGDIFPMSFVRAVRPEHVLVIVHVLPHIHLHMCGRA
eukprot:366172-Chlamydomonas_euryale.AAC.8